uniref:Uncharacterized protein n=1 Tax=Siphoviridae sp. ctdcr45 TaxID=2825580 RepID=A0A8S5Q7Q8_9CAUD|nr:MAG TPA: hypothetical protein [Siphoviridae sp. ctdcr45]
MTTLTKNYRRNYRRKNKKRSDFNDYSRIYTGFESPTGHQMKKTEESCDSSVFLVLMRLCRVRLFRRSCRF